MHCTLHIALCVLPEACLTLSIGALASQSLPAATSPPWFNMSASGTSIRTPTPPPSAAEPNVRENTTCGRNRLRLLTGHGLPQDQHTELRVVTQGAEKSRDLSIGVAI